MSNQRWWTSSSETGVLWDGHGPIPGSLETLKKLLEKGKKVFYITNNSSRTREQYVEKCHQFGFPATVDNILCTAYIAALYLHNQKFQDKVFLVGNDGMAAELDALGIRHTGTGPDPIVGSLTEWVNMEFDPEVKCVLVGFDLNINYMKIMKAASYLQNPDCLFLGTNEDSYLPAVNSKTRVPGTGTIVKAVSVPAEREPIIVGKPSPSMFEELRKLHNLEPSRCVMVGDRIATDIGLAKACGLKSLLVLSGVTSEAEVLRDCGEQNGEAGKGGSQNGPMIPDYYTSCLGDLGKFI
ncbi:glycerol-3-phosphate phosphatase-like isoform X2 [Babylonia areolata]|uniref:glycerol-3-phosphate phosphatase-like isoform X2 n=1 Tax=Babylonia areolata TaxID=304850 RepID=UPI003FD6AB14